MEGNTGNQKMGRTERQKKVAIRMTVLMISCPETFSSFFLAVGSLIRGSLFCQLRITLFLSLSLLDRESE